MFSEQILSLTQLSLHWGDLRHHRRGDLNSRCTTLIYQVKWGKESKVSECPCCLQAAEPSSLSLPRLLKNSFPSQHTIPFVSSCSPLTSKRKLVSLCHHVQESMGTTDKSRNREGCNHPSEIGFIQSWSTGWGPPRPPDLFWWKSVLARRQIRNRQMENYCLKIIWLFGLWTSNSNKTTLLSMFQWTVLAQFLVKGNFLLPYCLPIVFSFLIIPVSTKIQRKVGNLKRKI